MCCTLFVALQRLYSSLPSNDPNGSGRHSPAGFQKPCRMRAFSLASLSGPAFIVVACLLLVGQGCSSNESDTSTDPTGTERITANCEDALFSGWDQVQPERLEISSSESSATGMLNGWLADCGADELTSLSRAGQVEEHPLLTRAQSRRIAAQRFSRRDVQHMRDAVLFRKLSLMIMSMADNDVDRVVQAFYYVVRHIALLPSTDDRPSLTPFETLLLGRGTADDRAWILAEILRQAFLDVVLIRSAEDDQPSGADPYWITGVLVDDDVLLFDPRLGLPLPAADESSPRMLPLRPATLAALSRDPAPLEQWHIDGEQEYPLAGSNLSSLRVAIVGNSSYWAHRMRVLHSRLAGDRAVLVFDGTADSQLARVVAAGGNLWSRSDLEIWNYPEERLTAAEFREETESGRVEEILKPFDVPLELAIDRRGGVPVVVFKKKELRQLNTRIEQLAGDSSSDVTRSYVQVRHRSSELRDYVPVDSQTLVPVPEGILQVHRRAAEDALFWTGISQFEREETLSAVDTFRDYQRHYPAGQWRDAANYLMALAHAGRQDWARAIEAIDKTLTPQAPQSVGNALLKRRWQELSAAPTVGESTQDPAATR